MEYSREQLIQQKRLQLKIIDLSIGHFSWNALRLRNTQFGCWSYNWHRRRFI